MINRHHYLPLLAGLLLAFSPAFAASDAGPEPYSAPVPTEKPEKQEPLIKKQMPEKASLGDAESIKGPAAGPEPYSAADPSYPPMGKEPVYRPKPKGPAPKL